MSRIKIIFAAFAVFQVFTTAVVCQINSTAESVSMPRVVNVDKPLTFQINAKDLPKPFETKSVRRNSKVVPPPIPTRIRFTFCAIKTKTARF